MRPLIPVIVGFLSLGWLLNDAEFDQKRKGRASRAHGGVPRIAEVKPASASVGTKVRIEGENFGPETPVVAFNGIPAVVREVELDELRVFVPEGATSGPLVVTLRGEKSNAVHFVIETRPHLSGVSVPTSPSPITFKTDSATAGQSNSTKPVFFSKDVQPIFDRNCTSCHGGSAGLFLEEGDSYANLVNVPATKGCISEERVIPGNSSASVLYKRISGTSCGTQMPKKAPPLTPEEIGTIKRWIDQGALND